MSLPFIPIPEEARSDANLRLQRSFNGTGRAAVVFSPPLSEFQLNRSNGLSNSWYGQSLRGTVSVFPRPAACRVAAYRRFEMRFSGRVFRYAKEPAVPREHLHMWWLLSVCMTGQHGVDPWLLAARVDVAHIVMGAVMDWTQRNFVASRARWHKPRRTVRV